MALHHQHLPMLADANIVEWESGHETVRYYPNDVVEDVLAVLDEAAD